MEIAWPSCEKAGRRDKNGHIHHLKKTCHSRGNQVGNHEGLKGFPRFRQEFLANGLVVIDDFFNPEGLAEVFGTSTLHPHIFPWKKRRGKPEMPPRWQYALEASEMRAGISFFFGSDF